VSEEAVQWPVKGDSEERIVCGWAPGVGPPLFGDVAARR
jgi:hypothetical protein